MSRREYDLIVRTMSAMSANPVTAQALANALNGTTETSLVWADGGVEVAGTWLEIDGEASDALCVWRGHPYTASESESRWMVAGGLAVEYTDGIGWQPVDLGVEPDVTGVIDIASIRQRPAALPGIAKRLLAGVQSIADRAGNPVLVARHKGTSASEYHDHDVLLVIRPGAATDDGGEHREVTGTITWAIHVANSGRLNWTPTYDEPRLDLTVTSRQTGEQTWFAGAVKLYAPELVADSPGTVNQELVRLLRLIAQRAVLAAALR